MTVPTTAIAENPALPQLIISRAPRDAVAMKYEPPNHLVTRSARIRVDVSLLGVLKRQVDEAKDGRFPRFVLRPFEDVSIIVELRRASVSEKEPGARAYMGATLATGPSGSEYKEHGYFGVSENDGVLRGTVRFGNMAYEFGYSPQEGQIVRAIDVDKIRMGDDAITGLLPTEPQKRGSSHKSHLVDVNALVAPNIPTAGFAKNPPLPQLIISRAPRDAVAMKAEPPSPEIPRSARIEVDAALFETLKIQLENVRNNQYLRIEIRPFEDVSIIVELRGTSVSKLDPTTRGFYGGTLAPHPSGTGYTELSSIGFGVQNGIIRGTISVGNMHYVFSHSAREGQIVRVTDGSKRLFGDDAVPVGGQKESEKRGTAKSILVTDISPSAANVAPGSLVVDILIPFTAAARIAAGEDGEINRKINTSIGDANHAYLESGVNHRLRLVYAGQTPIRREWRRAAIT